MEMGDFEEAIKYINVESNEHGQSTERIYKR